MPDEILITADELDIDAIFANANRVVKQRSDFPVITQDPDKLQDAFVALTGRQARFEPGDLATWKPEMRNRRVPDYHQPCVVMRWLPEVIECEVTTPNGVVAAIDLIDLEVGAHDDEGDFCTFVLDSRRLTHWERLP